MTKWLTGIPMIVDASKMKRMKAVLLSMVCTAVICSPAGYVSAQTHIIRLENSIGQMPDTNSQNPGGQIPDGNNQDSNGQLPSGSNQNLNEQLPDNNNQNPNGQLPDSNNQNLNGQLPDSNHQNPNEQLPDGSHPGSNGQLPERDDQDLNGQIPDRDSQNPDTQLPDGEDSGEMRPGDAEEERDEEKEAETVKVTASVGLGKDGTSAKVSWKKTGNGKVTSYLVQRGSARNGDFKTIARLETGKSYLDQKVASANRYYYRVAAKTKSGDLIYSKVCKFQCPLEPLPGVKLVRYSTSSVKVMWNKSSNQHAVWYKVYYAKSKSGKYKLAGVTKNNWYRVTGLKNQQDYYFGVKACTTKNVSGFDSQLSKVAKMRMRTYERTTIFAGDSITTGLTAYRVMDEIAIGGKKDVVAAIGLNTITFRTKKVFNGKSAVERIIASKPYRAYLMLGDNDIHFRNKNDLIDGYREIVKAIQAGTPDTDLVILAASPVTAAEVSRRRGFAQIPAYNQALRALAAEMGVRYYDCTGFLKDSTGWLKSSYNAGDGVHWTSAAYHEYAKRLTAYDKSLD